MVAHALISNISKKESDCNLARVQIFQSIELQRLSFCIKKDFVQNPHDCPTVFKYIVQNSTLFSMV
jgi:hypothetical protein